METRNDQELGALWLRTSAKGDYMTGTIKIDGTEIQVVCFRNKSDNAKAPTWRVLKSKPRDESAPRQPHNANRTPLDDF